MAENYAVRKEQTNAMNQKEMRETLQPERFGLYLKKLRKRKGLSVRDFPEVPGPTVSRIETGRHEPTPKTIRKLSAALSVTHIGLMIKADHVTEDEVLTMRREHGIHD